VRQAVKEKAKEYLGTDRSYRKVVEHEGVPILYDDRQQAEPQEPRGLAPSTAWRWLSWLSGLTDTLRAACGLVRQKASAAGVHREPWAVPAAKYRSDQRREALGRAMQLLAVGRLFAGLYGREIFPGLATVHGWR
jgi:hypothetical protein